MVSRKRAREEAEEDDPSVRVVIKRNEPLPSSSPQDGVEHGLLHQLRNMWEFSNLIQFIYSFGKAVKISEDIDIDVSDPQLFTLAHSIDIDSCSPAIGLHFSSPRF